MHVPIRDVANGKFYTIRDSNLKIFTKIGTEYLNIEIVEIR